MLFFADSTLRERSRRFDTMRSHIGQALNDPNIQSRLGDLANGLRIANGTSFLPNVRNGEVSIPRDYQGTDGIAVLPRLDIIEDRVLLPDPTILQPAHTTRERMTAHHAELGQPIGRKALQGAIELAVGQTIGEWAHDCFAACVPQTHYSNLNMGPYIALGRPIVVLPPDMPDPSNIVNALSGVNELTHGYDVLQTPILPQEADPYANLRSELRGYAAGGAVVDAALEDGQIDHKFAKERFGQLLTINATREGYGLTTEHVLAPDFAFTEQLKELANELAEHMSVPGSVGIST